MGKSPYMGLLTIYRFNRKVSEGDISLISKATQHDRDTGDLFSSRWDLQKPEFFTDLIAAVYSFFILSNSQKKKQYFFQPYVSESELSKAATLGERC